MCEYGTDSNYRVGRNGYAMRLGEFLNDKVTIKNLAISGRSSKDFVTFDNSSSVVTQYGRPYYEEYINSVKAGDYVLIGFGHNDEKPENVDRFSFVIDDEDDMEVEGSFQYNLYNYYIKPAIEKGATPILATPIVRRTASSELKGSNVHNTSKYNVYLYMKNGAVAGSKANVPSGYTAVEGTTYEGNKDYMTVVKGLENGTITLGAKECILISNVCGGDYAQAIRDLAKKLNIVCIDNTANTKALYEEIGADETAKLHAEYNDKYMTSKKYVNTDGSYNESKRTDNTHLRENGARVIAYIIADAIKKSESNLKAYVKEDIVNPLA